MTIQKTLQLFVIIGCLLLPTTNFSQSKKKKNKKTEVIAPTPPKKKDNGIKDYSEVITKDAITDDGLFKVHKIKDKYYYEIPFNLLNKDMLLVSRIAKLPS